MSNDIYFGTYARYTTTRKEEGVALLGADHLVGDIYTIELELQEDRSYRAWLVNRFGAKIAFLEDDQVLRVQTYAARGWTQRALLSFVAFDDITQSYWGEVALLFNDPHYDEAFNTFASHMRELMGEGIRPQINFNDDTAKQIIASKGDWQPSGRVDFPVLEKSSAYVKKCRSASEKMIEKGRAGNKGCLAFTYVIWGVVAVAVIAGIGKLLGLF